MASFLVAEEAIALVCLNPSIDGTGLHSVAVAANSDGLIYRNDTNIGAPDRIEAVSDLWAPYPGLGSIGDVLVLKRRLTMMIDAQTAVAGSAAPRGAI